jgi:hypothetical protein
MESYNDYYYYELSRDEGFRLGLALSTSLSKYYLSYVFIHGAYTFENVMDLTGYGTLPLIFFSKCDDKSFITNSSTFSPYYGRLFKIKRNYSVFNDYKVEAEKIYKNDREILYSKIPSWVEGRKCIKAIFYIKEVCKNELPEDVIKYMLQFIKN